MEAEKVDSPNRGGAPLGNVNAMRHGRRSDRFGLAIGLLGKKYGTLYNGLKRARRAVESHVEAAKGKIGLADAHRVDGLILALLVGAIARRQLAVAKGAGDVDKLLGKLIWSEQRRTAMLGELGISGSGGHSDPWTALISPMEADEPEPASLPSDATDGTTGHQEAGL